MNQVPESPGDLQSQRLLVGRERERTILRSCLSDAVAGQGRTALVFGEAGIGKTSLVQDLVNWAHGNPITILEGHCYDLTATPPYGLWIELIQTYRPQSGFPEAPGFATDESALAGLGSQDALFRETLAFVTDLSQHQPVLLILEDVHWADRASLDLLRFLARQTRQLPILLIVTYRDDETSGDHPLDQIGPLIVREANPERIELRAIDREAVTHLASSYVPLPANELEQLVISLLRWAEGNPLFTIELLRELEINDQLASSATGWTLGELDQTSVPVVVRQLIERRISRLSTSSVATLQRAAVVGQNVLLDQLRQLADESSSANALEEAMQAQLIDEMEHGAGFWFRHALVREAIYTSLSLVQRRDIHQQIADASITQGNSTPEFVAYHLLQSGDRRAPDWLIQAGEFAERRFAWHDAFSYYDRAATLMRRQGDDPRSLARLLLKIGRLFRFSDLQRAITYFRESRELARSCGDDSIAALALFNIGVNRCNLQEIRRGLVDMRNAVEALTEAHGSPEEEVRWGQAAWAHGHQIDPRITTAAALVNSLAGFGRFNEAVSIADRYLGNSWLEAKDEQRFEEVARQTAGSIDGYLGLTFAFSALGRPDDAKLTLNLAREITSQVGIVPMKAAIATVDLIVNHYPYSTTDLHERAQLFALIEDNFHSPSGFIDVRNISWGYFTYLLHAGEWDLLRKLLKTCEPPSMFTAEVNNAIVECRLAWYQGDHDDAWKRLNEILQDGPDTPPDDRAGFLPAELQRIAAEMALDLGELGRARDWLDAHDRWMEWSGAIRGKPDGLLLHGKYSLAHNDRESAFDFAERALRQAENPRQWISLIRVHRFLGELLTATGNHDAARHHLEESQRLSVSCALPFEHALTLAAMSALEIDTGDQSAARGHLSNARRICSELGAHPVLARLEKLARQLRPDRGDPGSGLSRRELEVLALVAQGMSDKQIGDALFISHHTVTRHVSSILRKLDVESRTAAAIRASQDSLI